MQKVLSLLISQLIEQLDPETLKNYIDSGLDAIENKIGKTDTKWDDATILPIIAAVRKILDIQDEKYGSDKK